MTTDVFVPIFELFQDTIDSFGESDTVIGLFFMEAEFFDSIFQIYQEATLLLADTFDSEDIYLTCDWVVILVIIVSVNELSIPEFTSIPVIVRPEIPVVFKIIYNIGYGLFIHRLDTLLLKFCQSFITIWFLVDEVSTVHFYY